MRSFSKYKLCTESYERMQKRGRVNQASVLIFKHRRKTFVAELRCGNNDTVDFWKEGDQLIVVSINTRMDYCGLDVYELSEPALPDDCSRSNRFLAQRTTDEIFLQGTEQVEGVLGKNALDRLTTLTVARRLLDVTEACR